MKTLRPDILLRSPDGTNISVVEIKNLKNLSRDIATIARRNTLEYARVSQAPYFLLLSQDRGFLWKEPEPGGIDAPPNYEFPMERVVARYSNGMESTDRLGEAYLQLLFLQWLLDLSNVPQTVEGEPEKSLALSGFLQSIQGAEVLAEL